MGCNPSSSDSIVFNENRIASVIAALTLTLGINGPLDLGGGREGGRGNRFPSVTMYSNTRLMLSLGVSKDLDLDLDLVAITTQTILFANRSTKFIQRPVWFQCGPRPRWIRSVKGEWIRVCVMVVTQKKTQLTFNNLSYWFSFSHLCLRVLGGNKRPTHIG